jgi:RNA ligase (TIGR02306 family)
MSDFSVQVLRLDSVEPHPNADRLDIAQIGGYRSIVPKNTYRTGDLVIYIPESAVVPQWLMEDQGLVGMLSGSQKNRVRPVRLRGIFSEGIVVPLTVLEKVDDISAVLGITKYEPPVPTHMAGQVGALHGYTRSYDFENIKRHPYLFDDTDNVVLTEKLHGTFIEAGWCADIKPREDLFGDGRVFVTSKGLAGGGKYLKNVPENDDNLYVKTLLANALNVKLPKLAEEYGLRRVYVFGEVFGDVQDLKYGCSPGQTKMRVFDIYTESRTYEGFSGVSGLNHFASELGLEIVPTVTSGPWSAVRPLLTSYTNGNSILAPGQIREGVVIKTIVETYHPRYGRKIAKSISEDYAMRKGHNLTELQ